MFPLPFEDMACLQARRIPYSLCLSTFTVCENLISNKERIYLIKRTAFCSILAVITFAVREYLNFHIKLDFIPFLLYVFIWYESVYCAVLDRL